MMAEISGIIMGARWLAEVLMKDASHALPTISRRMIYDVVVSRSGVGRKK